MEGANEAGRRAARGVLHAAGLAAEGVRVFEFPAINRFRIMRALDERLHQAGLAHCFDWGGALVRAFKRGAEKARSLPQRVPTGKDRDATPAVQ
jgi:hypothetical protein